MSKFTSNISLLIISLFLAVGIVSIKGKEKIDRRYISGVQVTVENLPPNIMLPPDPWISPMVSLTIQGPKNFIEFVRADKASFRIDYTNIPTPDIGNPVTVLLNNNMFRTNLDPQDSSKINVLEDSIRPRQVVLKVFPWDIEDPLPELSRNGIENEKIFIPLLRIQKDIPVVVPQEGELPEGYSVSYIDVDPSYINVTGRRDAVDQIKSVSTVPLSLNYLSTDTNESSNYILQLEGFGGTNVQPVTEATSNEKISSVTVTVQISKTQ